MSEPRDPICDLQERARRELDAGRWSAAEEVLREALGLLDQRGEARHPDAANLRSELAALLNAQRRDDQALLESETALEIAHEALRTCDELDASAEVRGAIRAIALECRSQRSVALRGSGRYEEAEAEARAALAGSAALWGPQAIETAAFWNNLGVVLKYRGKLDGAAEAYERARANAGDDTRFAGTLAYNLGGLAHARSDWARGERSVREALALLEPDLGELHPDVIACWSTLGALLLGAGRFDEAERALGETRARAARAFGERHPDVALADANLSELLRQRGDYPRAEDLARRALALRRAVLPAGHPQIASSLNNLAALRADRGDARAARALWDEARTILDAAPHADLPVSKRVRAHHDALAPTAFEPDGPR